MTSRPAAPQGPTRPTTTLARLPRDGDTLDLVRLAAAALALLSPVLPGLGPVAGVVGVVVFFAVSGYVVAGVACAEPGPQRTTRDRSPALTVLLLVLAAYVASAVLGVALVAVAHLPLVPTLPSLPFALALPSSLWLVVPLVLLVGRDPGRARLALGVAGAAAALGTLAWVSGQGSGLPLVSTSWAVLLLAGAAVSGVEQRAIPLG